MEIEEQLSDLLSEFARTLGTDFPIQAIMDQLAVRIVEVLPISAAGVTLISPGTGPRYVAASDASALRFEQLQSELNEGPCVEAYETGNAVAVVDLRNDDRFPAFATRAVEAGLVAVFTFPLRWGDEQLGALDLYRTTLGPLDARAMVVAQTLADVAAAYLLNARARVELGAAEDLESARTEAEPANLIRAQEDERRRIAADIHDDSVQALIAASLRVDRLRRHLSEPETGLLDDVEKAIAEAVVRLRRLMFDLAPPDLEEQGIGGALRLYLSETFDPLGVPWSVVDDTVEETGQETRALAYRLTRELLSNVLKHAQAHCVEVTVTSVAEGIAVRVSDDGVGFDTSGRVPAAGHMGLFNLSSMAIAARGWSRVRSDPGSGTVAELWLPELSA